MKNMMKTPDDSKTAAPSSSQSPPKRRTTDKAKESASGPAPKPRKPRATGAQKTSTPAYPEPEVVGGHEPSGKSRKRRHNRHHKEDEAANAQPAQGNPAVDADELVARAWKIFKGEVTEEGLALMDDRTAAETARRAFRVAELFLIEAAAHRPSESS